jgi:hypothetical protein
MLPAVPEEIAALRFHAPSMKKGMIKELLRNEVFERVLAIIKFSYSNYL